jgi:hypothetical protein
MLNKKGRKVRKMKRLLIALVLCMVLVGIMVTPVMAQAPTATYNVSCIEISAGSFDGTNTNGATFTGLATQPSPFSFGLLYTSVNYKGTVPTAPPWSNEIVGGKWSLAVTAGKVKGTISGIITGGGITWATYNGMPNTGRGTATITLQITGGTNGFKGITGTGSFAGFDTHASGIWVTLGNTKIQVPTLTGKLMLDYQLN